jgi:hypothetical protein
MYDDVTYGIPGRSTCGRGADRRANRARRLTSSGLGSSPAASIAVCHVCVLVQYVCVLVCVLV